MLHNNNIYKPSSATHLGSLLQVRSARHIPLADPSNKKPGLQENVQVSPNNPVVLVVPFGQFRILSLGG